VAEFKVFPVPREEEEIDELEGSVLKTEEKIRG
jgi:hypothetical protein